MKAAALTQQVRLVPGGLTEADGERAGRELLRRKRAATAVSQLAFERATGWAEGRLDEPDEMVVPPHLVVRKTSARQ